MNYVHPLPSPPTPLPLTEGEGQYVARIAGGDSHKI
jgi:hypothetical protein